MKNIFIFLFPLNIFAFRLGIENMSSDFIRQLGQSPVGIVTNQTGVDQRGKRTIDILLEKKLNIKAVFVPEHGLDGTIKAACTVENGIDKKTGLPVTSLYKHGSGYIPSNVFSEIDAVIFDMQDVGMRHYTYISTLYTVMEAAARDKKRIIVCDRPNPLGNVMEGPICDAALCSFIGIAQIPLRHGMTIGELAQLFNNKCLKQKVDLHVLPLADYQRDIKLQTLQAHLSPNIKTLSSVHGYSFLGLLGEIKPFDVGVGTPSAFQVITLPEEHTVSLRAWENLQKELQEFGIYSKRYSYYHKQKNRSFAGIALQFKDINVVFGFKALLSVLSWTKKENIPVNFSPYFDKAIGTKEVRVWYKSDQMQDVLAKKITKELHEFLRVNEDVLLYQSVPKVVKRDVLDAFLLPYCVL
ncbi:MAG: DUF1343 domain-containing protein [Candidatus Dependentiae bacterium]